jgi:hypothetical protein
MCRGYVGYIEFESWQVLFRSCSHPGPCRSQSRMWPANFFILARARAVSPGRLLSRPVASCQFVQCCAWRVFFRLIPLLLVPAPDHLTYTHLDPHNQPASHARPCSPEAAATDTRPWRWRRTRSWSCWRAASLKHMVQHDGSCCRLGFRFVWVRIGVKFSLVMRIKLRHVRPLADPNLASCVRHDTK